MVQIPMPTRPDFFRRFEPKAEHDIQRLMPAFETEQQADGYRLKRIAILRKGGKRSRALADKLEATAAATTAGA
jgi:hypothetical protein